jgi:hypothetical protein
MKKTIYIIGATTNVDRLNIDAFEAVEHFLEKQGYASVKPHDLFDEWDQNSLPQNEHMLRRMHHLGKCDCVILLPGWADCSFAKAEHNHARSLQMQVIRYDQWMKVSTQRQTVSKVA